MNRLRKKRLRTGGGKVYNFGVRFPSLNLNQRCSPVRFTHARNKCLRLSLQNIAISRIVSFFRILFVTREISPLTDSSTRYLAQQPITVRVVAHLLPVAFPKTVPWCIVHLAITYTRSPAQLWNSTPSPPLPSRQAIPRLQQNLIYYDEYCYSVYIYLL